MGIGILFLTGLNITPIEGIPRYETKLYGRIMDSKENEPLNNATLLMWGLREFGNPKIASRTNSDAQGYYDLTTDTNFAKYLICAYYDNPDTEGIDGYPAFVEINSINSSNEINFSLQRASTVKLEGPIRLVDSLSSITNYEIKVLEYGSNESIMIDNTDYLYGTGPFSLNTLLQIDSKTIIVPPDKSIKLELKPSYFLDEVTSRRREKILHQISHNIIIEKPGGLVLGEGESISYDLRRFTVKRDLRLLDELIGVIQDKVEDNVRAGFYTIAERNDLSNILEIKDNAELKYSSSGYDEAYVHTREAYLSIKNLYSRLLSQRAEASISLQQLVMLISLDAIVASYLIFEDKKRKISCSIIFFIALSFLLYIVHPGKNFLPLPQYISVAILSIGEIFLVIYILPRLMGLKFEKEFNFISALASIISLGKRNLLRRKLRFILTFSSIFILSLSFVAMTSASMEFGLISNSQGWVRTDVRGIMVKHDPYNPTTPELKGRFYEISDDLIQWIGEVGGVVTVSRKAESFPKLEPYYYVGDNPINAILGLDFETEPLLSHLEEFIVHGSIPSMNGDGVLISEHIFRELDASLGDMVTVGNVTLTIGGVFDQKIRNLKDLNGELLVPNKQNDIVGDPSAPMITIEPCDYEYLIITDTDKAMEIDEDVGISRLALILDKDTDPVILAKSIALERGIRTWSSTGEGVTLAKVGDYFMGKGTLIIIPYAIVVLNVLITIFQSFYERRREINILSSVGFNPTHIGGILVVEAMVIGLLAGGLGHLAGLSLYPLLSLFSAAPVARQKISALWSLGTLGIALAAATMSVLVSLKWSVNITPSLSRKWSLNRKPKSYDEPWVIPIPAKIREDQCQDFISFLKNELNLYRNPNSYPNIVSLRGDLGEEGKNCSGELLFWYREGGTGVGGTSVKCIISMKKEPQDKVYRAELITYGGSNDIYKAGNFVRQVVMRWNI
jgi:hypothetical protein